MNTIDQLPLYRRLVNAADRASKHDQLDDAALLREAAEALEEFSCLLERHTAAIATAIRALKSL